MGALDNLIAATPSELLRAEVPGVKDDNGEPFVFYFHPFSISELKLIKRRANGNDLDALAHTVVIKCRNADGSAMFTTGDLDKLKTAVDSDYLASMVEAMNKTREDYEAAKKD